MEITTTLEAIERPEERRYTVFPIKRQKVFDFYKKAQESFWVEEELDTELSKDYKDWVELSPDIQNFIKTILTFFVVSDGVVNETLSESVITRIQTKEFKLWYNFQIMMEDIHNIVYSKLIDTYIKNESEKERLFQTAEKLPNIRKKIDWVHKWIGRENEINQLSDDTRATLATLEKLYNSTKQMMETLGAGSNANKNNKDMEKLFTDLNTHRSSLATLILINTIMEGVFFSGSFCAIFWIQNHYKKLPGLSKANEFISRDEGMHTNMGVYIYNTLENKLSQKKVHQIMSEAVNIEINFIAAALPNGLLGMNAELMTQYIQFVADQLLIGLKYDKIFEKTNPFPFMDKQSTSVRIGDFFSDGNISEYGHFASGADPSQQVFDFSE